MFLVGCIVVEEIFHRCNDIEKVKNWTKNAREITNGLF